MKTAGVLGSACEAAAGKFRLVEWKAEAKESEDLTEMRETTLLSPSVSSLPKYDSEGKLILKDTCAVDFCIPALSGQSELRALGYYFDSAARCRRVADDSVVGRLDTDKQFIEVSSAVQRFIFHLLRTHYQMAELRYVIPEAAAESSPGYKVFTSRSYQLKETVLFVIPGAVVRVGQSSRSICLKSGLSQGSALPFIQSALRRNWGIVLCDPNGNDSAETEEDSDDSTDEVEDGSEEVASDSRSEEHETSSSQEEDDDAAVHCAQVFDTLIFDRIVAATVSSSAVETRADVCNIRNVLFLVSSAGGWWLDHVLKKFGKFLSESELLKGIVYADAMVLPECAELFTKCSRHYRASDKPLGTLLCSDLSQVSVAEYSAGHSAHEWTQTCAFTEIFKFFDANLGMSY